MKFIRHPPSSSCASHSGSALDAGSSGSPPPSIRLSTLTTSNAAAVLETSAFDPSKAADVKVITKGSADLSGRSVPSEVVKERRGVGMFLPTRAGVEQAAEPVGDRFPRINTAFYHGGEPIRVIRPFLEGEEKKPYFLAMTAAGQSALNVKGLDTVVIDDTRFGNIIERGKNVLTRMHLGANEILQMAGRVHGRVEGGRVFILSDRDIQFSALRPTAPEFQLAGDSERVAMTCADLGVAADQLELPVPLDRMAYKKAVCLTRATRDNREWQAIELRQSRRSDAGRSSMGGAARQRRRRARPVPGSHELDRVAPSNDARGPRSIRRDRCPAATISPPTTFTLRPSRAAATWERCMDCRGIFSTRASRIGPSEARSAREVDRGCGAGDGEHLPQSGNGAACANGECARPHLQEVHGIARAVHAV